jgi:DNA-binding Xre family transcriptional regulator
MFANIHIDNFVKNVYDLPVKKIPEGGSPMIVRLRIKELARARDMKQYELAEKSGVTVQLLNRYWNNHTQSVALDQFVKIAKALDVNPGDLIQVIEENGDVNTQKEQPAA